MSSETDDHLVHEAVGPPLHPRQAAACIAMGVSALLSLGVLPILLGSLADEHRLTAARIGVAAMIELLAMGVATGLMGLVRRPARLRPIGVVVSLALALADLAALRTSGDWLLISRGAAGAAEGILLWFTVSMIARTVTPERWAGVFFTAQVLAQLVLAVAFAVWIVPAGGANGGFMALAAVAALGVLPALVTPSGFAPLSSNADQSGLPPPRGLLALFATVMFLSANGAVSVYLQPLAHQAHLGAGVARTAVWTSLIAQVCGAMTATALAGRVRYFTIFVITSTIFLATWAGFGANLPAALFVLDNVVAGFGALLLSPFLVPFTIDADPSRRAAVQSGAAQLMGGALGPWLASFVVGDADVRGVLWLGAGLLLAGLSLIATLRFTARR